MNVCTDFRKHSFEIASTATIQIKKTMLKVNITTGTAINLEKKGENMKANLWGHCVSEVIPYVSLFGQ